MILHEDTELLVLNKPSGMPSAPIRAGEVGTAVELALGLRPGIAQAGPKGLEGGLLHRLDTGTSGALAFAKTREAWERLRAAWSTGEVRKVYLARVSRSARPPRGEAPPLRPGRLSFPLSRLSKSSRRMVALLPHHPYRPSELRGAPLEAHSEVLSVRELVSHPDLRDVELRIETGVMHQIRCQLAAIGWPLLGDAVYGGPQAPRLALHASVLELPGQEPGSRIRVEAPLPEDWPLPSD